MNGPSLVFDVQIGQIPLDHIRVLRDDPDLKVFEIQTGPKHAEIMRMGITELMLTAGEGTVGPVGPGTAPTRVLWTLPELDDYWWVTLLDGAKYTWTVVCFAQHPGTFAWPPTLTTP